MNMNNIHKRGAKIHQAIEDMFEYVKVKRLIKGNLRIILVKYRSLFIHYKNIHFYCGYRGIFIFKS